MILWPTEGESHYSCLCQCGKQTDIRIPTQEIKNYVTETPCDNCGCYMLIIQEEHPSALTQWKNKLIKLQQSRDIMQEQLTEAEAKQERTTEMRMKFKNALKKVGIDDVIRNKDNHVQFMREGEIIATRDLKLNKFTIEKIQCQCGLETIACMLKQDTNIYIQDEPCDKCGNYMAEIITKQETP